MKIDAEKSTPKYLQLKEIIIQHFEKEYYQTGQKIPSENELMKRFAISRSTVRQTLNELANEGLIYKKQGLGSFYAGKPENAISRSYLIGVIVPRLSFYIYPQIIQGINDIAHQKRYNIVLGSSDVQPEKELACLEQLLEKRIDGLLIEPSGGFLRFEDSPNFQRVQALTMPVVFMDWALDDAAISYVAPDDVEGGLRATRYLIDAGHRRIACISPYDTLPGIQRRQGYCNALEACNIPYDDRLDQATSIVQWNDPRNIVNLVQNVLKLGDDRPTAIFFFNDDGALRGYEAIREAGLRVPEDISVMGFDDSDFAVVPDVPLTTMIHPKYQLGRWAAEILFEQLDHPEQRIPRQMLLNPTVAVRQSVRTLKKSQKTY